jgi:hypothetical protein
MVLREEQEKLKRLLSDAIPLLCKNALAFKNEFSIEALIGITVDKDKVILVSVNDTIHADTSSLEPDSQLEDSNEAEVKVERPRDSQRRKRKNPGRHLQVIQPLQAAQDEEDDDPYPGELSIVDSQAKRPKVSPVIKREPDHPEDAADSDLDSFLNSSQADDSTADYPTTSIQALPSTSALQQQQQQPQIPTLPDSLRPDDQPSPLQQPVRALASLLLTFALLLLILPVVNPRRTSFGQRASSSYASKLSYCSPKEKTQAFLFFLHSLTWVQTKKECLLL